MQHKQHKPQQNNGIVLYGCYTFLATDSVILTMKLIGSLTSPYVRKVRIVLAEKKLDYEFILDDPWASQPGIKEHNPLGKIPCLIMDEDDALFDSRVIVEYLDTLSPVSRLIPPAGRERTQVKRWEAIADGIMDAAATAFIENNRRPPELRSADWTNRQIGKIDAALDFMESILGDHNYCMGVNLCLADIAVGCALDYIDLRFPDKSWQTSYEKLAKLQQRLAEHDSFASTKPKIS